MYKTLQYNAVHETKWSDKNCKKRKIEKQVSRTMDRDNNIHGNTIIY